MLQKEFLARELFETMGIRPARLLLTPRKATRETGNVIWCQPARTQEIKYISSMFVLLSLKAASGLQLRAQSYQPACLGLFPGLLYSSLDHTALSAHTQGWFIFLPFKKTNEFLKIKENCVLLGHSLPFHQLSSNQPGQSLPSLLLPPGTWWVLSPRVAEARSSVINPRLQSGVTWGGGGGL